MADVRIRDLPDELHRRLKSMAALAGMTINDVAIEALQREVDRRERELAKRQAKG